MPASLPLRVPSRAADGCLVKYPCLQEGPATFNPWKMLEKFYKRTLPSVLIQLLVETLTEHSEDGNPSWGKQRSSTRGLYSQLPWETVRLGFSPTGYCFPAAPSGGRGQNGPARSAGGLAGSMRREPHTGSEDWQPPGACGAVPRPGPARPKDRSKGRAAGLCAHHQPRQGPLSPPRRADTGGAAACATDAPVSHEDRRA